MKMEWPSVRPIIRGPSSPASSAADLSAGSSGNGSELTISMRTRCGRLTPTRTAISCSAALSGFPTCAASLARASAHAIAAGRSAGSACLRSNLSGRRGEVAQVLDGVGDVGDDVVDAGLRQASLRVLDVVDVGPERDEDFHAGKAAAQALGEVACLRGGARRYGGDAHRLAAALLDFLHDLIGQKRVWHEARARLSGEREARDVVGFVMRGD